MFTLNAVMSALVCLLILRAPIDPVAVRFRNPHLLAVVAEGLRFTARSALLRAILLRAFIFFLQSIGLIALLLLLLLARQIGADAATYTALLASMGVGAVLAALRLLRLPGMAARDRIFCVGVLLYSAATVIAVFSSSLWTRVPALALSGVVCLCVVNSLTMSVQLVLPTALRARGMAIYQMTIMGGSAAGAAL